MNPNHYVHFMTDKSGGSNKAVKLILAEDPGLIHNSKLNVQSRKEKPLEKIHQKSPADSGEDKQLRKRVSGYVLALTLKGSKQR